MPEMQVFTGPLANASMNSGSPTAPAAAAVIATTTPPSGKGLYQIDVVAYLSGAAPAAADNKNIEFRFGGTTLSSIPLIPAANVQTTWRTYFTSDGVTAFTVNATATATAGVVYNVFLTATKVNN